MTYEHLIYQKQNHIATITLNQPEKLNALSAQMRDSFELALEEASKDRDVRVVVVTGAGRGFCSGADLTADRPAGEDEALGRDPFRLEARRVTSLHLYWLEKPTIAAVNGVAAGAGLGIALSCDIRISSEAARFSSIFVRRGLVPDNGVIYLLPRLVGMEKGFELMYTGDIVDAQEALRLGLTSRVVPADQLMSTAYELAGRIAKGPPITLSLIKRIGRKAMESNYFDALEYERYCQALVGTTEDTAEGRAAFREKRDPVFKGR